jgi:segregation and condensation protein B
VTEIYAQNGRGIRLLAVAGGFQFRTAPENASWVRALLRERPARLGRAAMETLAIVAYKQPATRADVESIRGVDADSALNTLLQKRLIKIAGRKEAAGRPLMYATTPEFLEVFGLNDLRELPTLKEIGPVPEDEEDESDDSTRGAAAEDSEPGGDRLAAYGGDPHPNGTGEGEREGGDGAGHESEPGA